MEPAKKQKNQGRTPLLAGSLQLLAGIFKVPSRRTVTLWPKTLAFSAANQPNKLGGVIPVDAVHVSSGSGGRKTQFVVRDGSTRTDHTFVAQDAQEAQKWVQALKAAVEARLQARRQALAADKERMDAIAARLGVHDVGKDKNKAVKTEADVVPPVLPDGIDAEAAARKLREAGDEGGTQSELPAAEDAEDAAAHRAALQQRVAELERRVADKQETAREEAAKREAAGEPALSQEMLNAASACGVDPATLQDQEQHGGRAAAGGRGYADRGSGGGKVRLEDDVYWYEVAPSDTLSGICLHFDTTESKLRSVNFLGKRSVAGVKVLRVPRRITGHPEHDYTSNGTAGGHDAAERGRLPEPPEVKRERQAAFKVHIMVLLSAQRALTAEDCFTPTEARAYLNLHDHDLNKALDAMEQDQEWDEKFGYLLRQRRAQREKARQQGARLHNVVVDGAAPDAIELKPLGSGGSEAAVVRGIKVQ